MKRRSLWYACLGLLCLGALALAVTTSAPKNASINAEPAVDGVSAIHSPTARSAPNTTLLRDIAGSPDPSNSNDFTVQQTSPAAAGNALIIGEPVQSGNTLFEGEVPEVVLGEFEEGNRNSLDTRCVISNTEHPGVSWINTTLLDVNNRVKVWFNPGSCGANPYPFRIDSVDIAIYAPAAGTFTWAIDIECPNVPGDSCSMPGYQLQIPDTFFYTWTAAGGFRFKVDLAPDVCVNGPFFLGLTYISWTGAQTARPSVMWDTSRVGNACTQWRCAPCCTDWRNIFSQQYWGRIRSRVFGNTGDGCTPVACQGSPCTIACQGGDLQELTEPATPDSVNMRNDPDGGCNLATPQFGAIACGQTVCGRGFTYVRPSGAQVRDTDWYLFTLTTRDTVKLQLHGAEFPVFFGVLDTTNCAQGGGAFYGSATVCNPCTPYLLNVGCLDPGTYAVFVAPAVFTGVPANPVKRYRLSLICTPCQQCEVSCPPGGILEGEVCPNDPDNFNGGCNSSPPAFSPIACGQTICGTAFERLTPDTLRDTDWYQVVVQQQDSFRFCVRAEFDVQAYILRAGAGDPCDSITAIASGTARECEDLCLSACLEPGTYWLFVAPQFYATVACGNYTATLTCVPCAQVAPCPPVSCNYDLLESEPNGGCASSPAEPFNAISCGQTARGAMTASASLRDVDAYELVLAQDRELTITVNPEFDAILWLYWASAPGACPDNNVFVANASGSCGNEVMVTGCLPAGVYHIYVAPAFGNMPAARFYCLTVNCGIPCPYPFACPQNSLVSQLPSMTTMGWTASTSDSGTTERYAGVDDFSGLTQQISTLRFWGINAYYSGGWSACAENPMPFYIRLMADNGGVPGNVVCSYSMTLTGAATGFSYAGYQLYEYNAVLTPPCCLGSGWVSVQGSGNPNCWFLWMSSPFFGNGEALQWNGTTYTVRDFDYALCMGTSACQPADSVRAYLNGTNTNMSIHFYAPVSGEYRIYSTLARDGSVPGTLEAIVNATAGTVTWLDTGALVGYKRYVVVHVCCP